MSQQYQRQKLKWKEQGAKEERERIIELLKKWSYGYYNISSEHLRIKIKELNTLEELDESPKETKVNDFHRKQQGSINSNSNELNLEKEKSL